MFTTKKSKSVHNATPQPDKQASTKLSTIVLDGSALLERKPERKVKEKNLAPKRWKKMFLDTGESKCGVILQDEQNDILPEKFVHKFPCNAYTAEETYLHTLRTHFVRNGTVESIIPTQKALRKYSMAATTRPDLSNCNDECVKSGLRLEQHEEYLWDERQHELIDAQDIRLAQLEDTMKTREAKLEAYIVHRLEATAADKVVQLGKNRQQLVRKKEMLAMHAKQALLTTAQRKPQSPVTLPALTKPAQRPLLIPSPLQEAVHDARMSLSSYTQMSQLAAGLQSKHTFSPKIRCGPSIKGQSSWRQRKNNEYMKQLDKIYNHMQVSKKSLGDSLHLEEDLFAAHPLPAVEGENGTQISTLGSPKVIGSARKRVHFGLARIQDINANKCSLILDLAHERKHSKLNSSGADSEQQSTMKQVTLEHEPCGDREEIPIEESILSARSCSPSTKQLGVAAIGRVRAPQTSSPLKLDSQSAELTSLSPVTKAFDARLEAPNRTVLPPLNIQLLSALSAVEANEATSMGSCCPKNDTNFTELSPTQLRKFQVHEKNICAALSSSENSIAEDTLPICSSSSLDCAASIDQTSAHLLELRKSPSIMDMKEVEARLCKAAEEHLMGLVSVTTYSLVNQLVYNSMLSTCHGKSDPVEQQAFHGEHLCDNLNADFAINSMTPVSSMTDFSTENLNFMALGHMETVARQPTDECSHSGSGAQNYVDDELPLTEVEAILQLIAERELAQLGIHLECADYFQV